MPLPEEPLLCAFPLFKLAETYTPLGCGFFVRADGRFLTAKHVLPDPPLRPGEKLIAALIRDGMPRLADVDQASLRTSPRFDLAGGRINTDQPLIPLGIARQNPAVNVDLLCVEFSRTGPVASGEGISEMRIRPSYQRGHIVSDYTDDLPGAETAKVIEVSFPALRGASGSAIVNGVTGDVIGVLIANRATHLMPAQLERVEGPAGVVEEVRYYLPYGLALSWEHLQEFVATWDDPT
jgi:hypothetical protein